LCWREILWFTGAVRVGPLFEAPDPARVRGASVTFEPGARTAWHTHPLGQTLIVTAGCGWAQREGGPVEEIRPGDVVWFAPGEKHWHGATATTAMTHIASRKHLTARPSTGWSTSATSSTAATIVALRREAPSDEANRAHACALRLDRPHTSPLVDTRGVSNYPPPTRRVMGKDIVAVICQELHLYHGLRYAAESRHT
jgi:quercetin dioxygenase-like cupin family protein